MVEQLRGIRIQLANFTESLKSLLIEREEFIKRFEALNKRIQELEAENAKLKADK